MKVELFCQEKGHNKFYTIETTDKEVIVTYGAVGTSGVSLVKAALPQDLEKVAEKLKADKMKKGYKEGIPVVSNWNVAKTPAGSYVGMGILPGLEICTRKPDYAFVGISADWASDIGFKPNLKNFNDELEESNNDGNVYFLKENIDKVIDFIKANVDFNRLDTWTDGVFAYCLEKRGDKHTLVTELGFCGEGWIPDFSKNFTVLFEGEEPAHISNCAEICPCDLKGIASLPLKDAKEVLKTLDLNQDVGWDGLNAYDANLLMWFIVNKNKPLVDFIMTLPNSGAAHTVLDENGKLLTVPHLIAEYLP